MVRLVRHADEHARDRVLVVPERKPGDCHLRAARRAQVLVPRPSLYCDG
jgi:hypothetical protein